MAKTKRDNTFLLADERREMDKLMLLGKEMGLHTKVAVLEQAVKMFTVRLDMSVRGNYARQDALSIFASSRGQNLELYTQFQTDYKKP